MIISDHSLSIEKVLITHGHDGILFTLYTVDHTAGLPSILSLCMELQGYYPSVHMFDPQKYTTGCVEDGYQMTKQGNAKSLPALPVDILKQSDGDVFTVGEATIEV